MEGSWLPPYDVIWWAWLGPSQKSHKIECYKIHSERFHLLTHWLYVVLSHEFFINDYSCCFLTFFLYTFTLPYMTSVLFLLDMLILLMYILLVFIYDLHIVLLLAVQLSTYLLFITAAKVIFLSINTIFGKHWVSAAQSIWCWFFTVIGSDETHGLYGMLCYICGNLYSASDRRLFRGALSVTDRWKEKSSNYVVTQLIFPIVQEECHSRVQATRNC